MRSNHETEIEDRQAILRSQSYALIACQRQLANLTCMRLKILLSDGEYVVQRERLSNELCRHEEALHATELRGERR